MGDDVPKIGGCVSPAAGVIVCSPSTFLLRRVRKCPTCQKRRRMVGRDQVWYGRTFTCLGCGDSWENGELLPRPFKRAWRVAAIAEAKRTWARAADFAGLDYQEWFNEQIGMS